MKNKGILKSIIGILVIILLIYVWRETSWNFTFLGVLGLSLIIIIGGMPLYLSQNNRKNGRLGNFYKVYGLNSNIPKVSPVKDHRIAWWASMLILVFTCFTFVTLNNYFYASESVYTNNEHHALRVEGVTISNPAGFTLVQNDKKAFFDSDKFNGSVVIEEYNDEGVTLSYNGFTHPIYRQTGTKDTLLNTLSSVISFKAGEIVTFENKKGKTLEFKFEEYNGSKGIISSPKDSAEYFIRHPGADWQKPSNTTLFLRGYSFGSMLSGKNIDTEGFDFNGINIIRAYSNPRAKHYERADNDGTIYLLDINSIALGDEDDKINRISVGETSVALTDKDYFTGKVKVKYGENILFGYGEDATRPFSFALDSVRNALTVKFKMPIYRQLYCVEDKKVNSLYVTNSLLKDLKAGNDSVADVNAPDNVLLFDFFEKWDNVNAIKPFNIFFASGNTAEQMTLLCNAGGEERSYRAGEHFNGVCSDGNEDIEWHFYIENLRETTPFDAKKMLLLVWAVAIVSIILINFHNIFGGSNVYKYHRNSYSHAEFAAYITIIYFVAFRCFLLWRTTVFRPLENVSFYELNSIFYNSNNFNILLFSLGFFYSAIFILKFILLHSCKRPEYNSVVDIVRKDAIYSKIRDLVLKFRTGKYFFAIVPALYVTSACISVLLDSRKGLLVAIVVYFITDILINIRSKQCTNTVFEETDKEDAVSCFIYSLANMIFTAAVMGVIIKDSGFLVMFGTYCMLAFCLKLHDLYTRVRKQSRSKYLLRIFLVSTSLLTVVLLFYKTIVLFALNSSYFILAVALILAAILICVGLLAGVLHFNSRFPFIHWNGKPIAIMWHITLIGIICGVIANASDLKLSEELGDHTLQRINVQLYEPHEALAKTENNREELLFLQASHNHFIIEQYYERSKDVALFGEGGDGFLKIHPQSKLGAMWNAQLTDIVLLRYVITEHAKILPAIFLGFFLMLFYYGMRKTTYFKFTKSLLTQIPLLLFVQGWLVWLANTQRFIFFGQDFPLLSITARIMVVYVFILLLIWMSAAILESVMERIMWQLDENTEQNVYEETHKLNSLHSLVITFFGVTILIVSLVFSEPAAKGSDGEYNVDELFKKSEKYIDKINSLFIKYQDGMDEPLTLRKNMHSQIQSFDNMYGDSIKALFVAEALEQPDTTEYKFALRMWKNYVANSSYSNSYTGLMHAYKKGGYLQFATRGDYYDLTLPTRHELQWKNHIVEDYVAAENRDTVIANGDYVYYQLPENWVKSGQTCRLIRGNNESGLNVVSLGDNRKISLAGSGFKNAVALNAGDFVCIGNRRIEELPIEKHNYWARNIIINGKRRCIYPQSEAMYWIRDFARIVERKSDYQDGDVAITLNKDLTTRLYDVIKKSSKSYNTYNSRSVIVADGNGHIRAMVDYKLDYELDPNDDERISKLVEYLYMNELGNKNSEESSYFENGNLTHMRGGPGSTQKPLVWNAVASAVDFNWKDLILCKIIASNLKDGKLKQYNGSSMLGNKYQAADELKGQMDISLPNFLAHSSNYYSALMVYLGMHNVSTYKNKNALVPISKNDTAKSSVFRYFITQPEKLSAQEYQNNYPFVKIGDNGRIMTLNKKISHIDYNKSVLHHQFTNVMGLCDHNITRSDSSRMANSLYPKYLSNGRNYGFAVPATSSLNLALLNDESRGNNSANNAMRNISLGGIEFWTVTPFKMAEMYGKVVSLNKEFTLSLDPSHKNKTEAWGTEYHNYKVARTQMFKGMNSFFTQYLKQADCQATGLGIIKAGIDNVGSKTINHKTYYFYGKTGTANNDNYKRTKIGTIEETSKLEELIKNGQIDKVKKLVDEKDLKKDKSGEIIGIKGDKDLFRRLAIIISNTNLHDKQLDDEALEKVKFYVLFITFDYKNDNFNFTETSKNIVDAVLNSKIFNDYMNN